jgi:hypothetical protein
MQSNSTPIIATSGNTDIHSNIIYSNIIYSNTNIMHINTFPMKHIVK